MIADLKPYAKYKKSGLPWLGSVPAHWEVRQARHIGRFLKGVGGTKEDAVPAGVPCVRYGELYTTYTYFIRASKAFIRAERAAGYMPIQYGDVLFAASGETIERLGSRRSTSCRPQQFAAAMSSSCGPVSLFMRRFSDMQWAAVLRQTRRPPWEGARP
jgi:hypothetical protein